MWRAALHPLLALPHATGGACARRPAGLHLPDDVRWFSVNFPDCATLKAERMNQVSRGGAKS